MKKILYIVIPCYNEEKILNMTTERLTIKLNDMISTNLIDAESKIMYINDGSVDNTWNLVEELSKKNKFVLGISLSKNSGQQNALYAGLMEAKKYADVVITMDADLQDDVEVMDKFILKYNEGNEIVYGVRNSRKKDKFFKRTTAIFFYKFMKFLGTDIVYNHADYRLMGKKALNALEEFSEVNLFLRGIIPLLGFKTAIVEYERKERVAGKSKYTLNKMCSFALDGVLSFSVRPIRIITVCGIVVSLFSFAYLIYVVLCHLISNNAEPGWTTIIALICFFGGAQILCIGIIGEYIGKIYGETKRRPRYIVDKKIVGARRDEE